MASGKKSGGVLDEIYARLDPRRVFQKLELTERGRRFVGRCPQCGERSVYVLKFDPRYAGMKARCNRLNTCGFSVSAWDYLRTLEGIPEPEILRTLAERAGVELTRRGVDPQTAAESWKRRERRAGLCERFWTWAGERLWAEACHPQSEAARTVALLAARGYGEPLARAMGLAYLPPAAETRAFLLQGGADEEDLRSLAFLDPAFDRRNGAGARIYTLAIPYPELQSLIARATLPADELPGDAPKYRYPKGLTLDAPAFLRSVDRRKPVVVVEGFLDAALGQAWAELGEGQGAPSIESSKPKIQNPLSAQLVATGTNRLNRAQVEALQAAGVRELILCFDADRGTDGAPGAGARGTLETLERLAEAGTFFPRVLRIPEELGCKDPDEVLTRHGLAVWEALLAERTQSEAEFRAALLLGPERARLSVSNGSAVWAELAEIVEREAARPARALFLGELLRILAAELALDEAALAAALEPFRKQAAQRRRAELLQRAALDVQAELGPRGSAAPDAEALTRVEASLREGLERAAALRDSDAGKDVLAPVSLAAYRAAVLERPDFLETPFRKLDEAAAIHPGRITLVAARPSHGKTTFLLNLVVHWLKRYPERRFVYFSYDGPREQLMSQLVSRVTRRYALREVEDALRGEVDPAHPEARELLEQAQASLRWLDAQQIEKRLFIVDRALTAGELCRAAKAISSDGPLGAVLVDYIQQIRPDRSKGRAMDTRQREVGYVSRALQALAQETGVPVIAAAQLNRVSETANRTDRPRLWQLREAGDLEQDATTVYGLYNHHQAAAEALPFDEGGNGAGSFGGYSVPPLGGRSAWTGGPVLGTASGGKARSRRNGAAKLGAALLEPGATAVDSAELMQAGRWSAPSALRSVALDIEVLKARHGRTHARVALTYDLIANYISDGKTDGRGEV